VTDGTPLKPRPETHTERLDHRGEVVHLIQITDTHLCETPGGTLLGMDTDHSLLAVIDCVNEERGRPDALLLTGDLSDRGAGPAYARVDAYSRQLTDAVFWLPGNHDSREEMAAILVGSNCLSSEIRIANWQVLLLDSLVPGKVGGELGPEQLALLKNSLRGAAQEGLYTLLCLHHPPVEIGCAWLDEQMLADAGAFFDIVDSHAGVKGILWGHIHQQIDRQRKGVMLMASPSSCVQFAPNSERFRADDLAPGYRWLDLHRDGTIETGVSRVEGVQFTVDLDSKGYI
jgi:Icc protein